METVSWLVFVSQCTDQLLAVQAELQESIKEVMKSRKRYQEAQTMAQALRDKAELDARYIQLINKAHLSGRSAAPVFLTVLLPLWDIERI